MNDFFFLCCDAVCDDKQNVKIYKFQQFGVYKSAQIKEHFEKEFTVQVLKTISW